MSDTRTAAELEAEVERLRARIAELEAALRVRTPKPSLFEPYRMTDLD